MGNTTAYFSEVTGLNLGSETGQANTGIGLK
jgi:hypothetical protein